jgi:hypothetical protein
MKQERKWLADITDELTLYYFPETDAYSIADCNGGDILFTKEDILYLVNVLENISALDHRLDDDEYLTQSGTVQQEIFDSLA